VSVMGVQFIKKPADGSLPFINANGFGIVEVMRTLKRFSQIANGGEIADSVHLNPIQVSHTGPVKLWDLNIVSDLEVLPSEGKLFIGDKLLAVIRNLSIPIENDPHLTAEQTSEIARTHFLKS
jgi:hypothetical protein